MRSLLHCRDLSKPVGALNEARLHLFQERFREMPQGEVTLLVPCHLACNCLCSQTSLCCCWDRSCS